jgi:putative Mn2+ efflux pump MntP
MCPYYSVEGFVGILEIVIIGLALSMDAFAVTIANSCAFPDSTRAQRLAMPVVFGVFQGLMPLIGFFAGSFAANIIDQYAGIIALIILGVIGGKMVWEGTKALLAARKTTHSDPVPVCYSPGETPRRLSAGALFLQGIATSIDALIVGVSFLAMGANIAVAAPMVALTTFLCCVVALLLGRRFGELLGDKAEIIGGIVLVLIGIKAFFG